MDEESKKVLQTYAKLNLPHLVARTLSNARPFLLVSIVGEQGVGKSTYAYYSVKVGLMAYLCKPHGINLFEEPERCASHLERNYGELCLTRECGKPDELDKTYEIDIYTGPRGLSALFGAVHRLVEVAMMCAAGERPAEPDGWGDICTAPRWSASWHVSARGGRSCFWTTSWRVRRTTWGRSTAAPTPPSES